MVGREDDTPFCLSAYLLGHPLGHVEIEIDDRFDDRILIKHHLPFRQSGVFIFAVGEECSLCFLARPFPFEIHRCRAQFIDDDRFVPLCETDSEIVFGPELARCLPFRPFVWSGASPIVECDADEIDIFISWIVVCLAWASTFMIYLSLTTEPYW